MLTLLIYKLHDTRKPIALHATQSCQLGQRFVPRISLCHSDLPVASTLSTFTAQRTSTYSSSFQFHGPMKAHLRHSKSVCFPDGPGTPAARRSTQICAQASIMVTAKVYRDSALKTGTIYRMQWCRPSTSIQSPFETTNGLTETRTRGRLQIVLNSSVWSISSRIKAPNVRHQTTARVAGTGLSISVCRRRYVARCQEIPQYSEILDWGPSTPNDTGDHILNKARAAPRDAQRLLRPVCSIMLQYLPVVAGLRSGDASSLIKSREQ